MSEGDNRQAGGHGFNGNNAEVFITGKEKCFRVGDEFLELLISEPAPEADIAQALCLRFKLLLERANVAVAPGVGFGEYGEGFVRIAMVENNQRLRQATRNIKSFLSGRNDLPELRRAARAEAAK